MVTISLSPLKIPENQWFSDVLRGYRMGSVAWMGRESHFFKKSVESLLYFIIQLHNLYFIKRVPFE